MTALPRFAWLGRDWIHPESLASDEVWQALLDLASANLKGNRSGVVTALPRFARPGRDWIHPECLASNEVWQAPLNLESATVQVSRPLCLASLGLGRIGFTLKVWQALLDLASAA